MTVTEEGFEHDGETYSSLRAVARVITGAHWSGPRKSLLAEFATRSLDSTHGTRKHTTVFECGARSRGL